ncbi:GPI-anchored cell wall beta-1,3-endoglucanase [Rhypophila sp. PSN 637]
MHSIPKLVALATTFTTALAAYQGFNYGSTFTTGAPKQESDFEAEFKAAGNLVGAPAGGFHSARLYTTVQGGTANDPISAIPAAIKTKTSLLLGIWASAGDAVFANELQALKSAITKYGSDFASLVAGISVGSEDLYRISPTGIMNKENPGAEPATIAGYIKQVRQAIAHTPLANAPIGHVDTWTAWVNGSNRAVVEACDWIGFDAYPYFQSTMANDISNGKSLFDEAFQATQAAVGGKPVWVTETGFPVSGKTVGQAVPSLKNAKAYWNDVGCSLFGTTNVWWYTFQDAAPATPNPSFGVIGSTLTSEPLFDLKCQKDVNLSLEISTFSTSVTAPSGTASDSPTDIGGSPSETGAGGPSSGTGSTGAGATPSPTGPATQGSGAGSLSGSVGAALAAFMAALLAV